jgi:hypothetical protein
LFKGLFSSNLKHPVAKGKFMENSTGNPPEAAREPGRDSIEVAGYHKALFAGKRRLMLYFCSQRIFWHNTILDKQPDGC